MLWRYSHIAITIFINVPLILLPCCYIIISKLALEKCKQGRSFKSVGLIFTRIYQDPSRLPAIGHHGWPSAGEKSKCLKIPPHVPQVMIKLPLKCIHRPHSDHLIIQPVPLITHPICKLEPPNFQPVPSSKQLEGMPSSTIILHNLE